MPQKTILFTLLLILFLLPANFSQAAELIEMNKIFHHKHCVILQEKLIRMEMEN